MLKSTFPIYFGHFETYEYFISFPFWSVFVCYIKYINTPQA